MTDSLKQIVMCGVHLDFRRSDETNFFSAFFGEKSLMSMLEVSDYDSTDIVSPLISALVNRFCSLFEAAEAIKSFTEYVDVVNCMYKKKSIPGWTKSEVSKLGYRLILLNSTTSQTLKACQASQLGNQKWHVFD